jgi:glycosyltransferase involved in cell wall biosynthesis
MLARAMRERGHEVLVVSFKRQYPRWLYPGETDKDPSQNPLTVSDVQYWLDSLNPLTWLSTFFRIRQSCPDVTVMQWWTPFWAPAWLLIGAMSRLFSQTEVLYCCHNVLPHEKRSWDRWLAKWTLRQGRAFIVQSAEERNQLLGLVPGAQAQVFPLPAFDMLADQKMPKSLARQELGLANNLPVLLFFGIVRQYKGLADLLRALPAIKAGLGEVLLVVAGEFWEDKQPYLDAISRMGIEDSVLIDDRYIPNEQAAVYFSAADILVAPYRQVTGSAVISTAHAFRLPVIATDLAGIAEVVNHQADRLVPPHEPDALAAAISETIARYTHTARPAGSYRKEFTWEQLVAAIENGDKQEDQSEL